MFRTLLSLGLSVVAVSALAQEPIRFARTPDISPDGRLVAFSYLGDIWTVEAIGGVARPVTLHEAHDVNPLFSPDGRQIAFSSNRHGQYDVFVIATHGGKVKRLTFDSAADMATSWTRDGKGIIFLSYRTTSFPGNPELFVVPVDGGREEKLPFVDAKDIAYSPAGNLVAFTRGPGSWYRKGYRGSSNDDLFLANPDGTAVRRICEHNGQDSYPMFSPDGKRIYFVSDVTAGPANIVQQDVTPPGAPCGTPRPLTSHRDDPVRRARISGNGEWIVYECGGDLWLVNTRDAQSRKMAIEVYADEKANTERQVTFRNEVTEFALSPDENTIAFIIHGEVFAMPTRGGKANRLTDTPAVEHGLAWSPDNKKLLFASDRSGYEELYVLESDDPENSDLSKALKFKTRALTNSVEPESGASFTSDGNRIAFIKSGKLWTMKVDGTDIKVLVDRSQVVDYDWSPDGKQIVYSLMDGSFGSELFIMPIDGSKPSVNVTRYATFNSDVTWGGTKIAFQSQRRGGNGVHVLSLQKPSTGSTSPPASEIDWDDIHQRVERIGAQSPMEVAISKNGKSVAFSSGGDLWVAGTDGGSTNRLASAVVPRNIRWTKGGTIYFLDAAGGIRNMMPGLGGIGGVAAQPNTVSFTAKLIIRRSEEYQQMFEQAWRLLSDSFYDAAHHGANWAAVREKYRPMVAHVSAKEDLYNLITLMLGELNASHLGISGTIRSPEEITADLGILFDESHKGPGLKIAEVLKRGPADKRGLNLKAGEIITSLDRVALNEKTNLSQLLNAKVNETVLLEVTSNPADPKASRKVEVQAVGRDRIGTLMYDRWVAKNAEAVAKQSGGKIGYIHIPSMDEAGLEQFVRMLYSDNFDKEAVVIDVRYNGGGFTHDDVLNYLNAKEHTYFRQRDGGEGTVMRNYHRKWTKPSAVLINNRSYSDAEIFPSAYRALGLGKVIGQATGGMVIGTVQTRLIDGSAFRLPRLGVYTTKNINMEREGVMPDVPVDVTPEDLARGNDLQLKKAVEVLTTDVVEWKKTRIAATATKPAPTTPAVTPMPMAMPAPK